VSRNMLIPNIFPPFIMGLLNSLPLNGAKTYTLLIAYLLVLGAGEAGYLDAGTVSLIVSWLTPAIGLAVAHKIDKK